MDLEQLFKKLRSSLSMRKNVPLSQLISECNSDWNISVYTIYSEITGVSSTNLRDIAEWLMTNESVNIKFTENNDYIISFQFGDEHADIQRYINVSKSKKKNKNSTSYKTDRHGENYMSKKSSNNFEYKQSFLTSSNNSYQKNKIRNCESNNVLSTEIKNSFHKVSCSGKAHLKNTLNHVIFMNKRLENQREMRKNQYGIVKEVRNLNFDKTCKKMDSLSIENKNSVENTICITKKDTINKEMEKYGKNRDDKLIKKNKTDPPKYICGADAIEALLKERKKVFPIESKKVTKNNEENKLDKNVEIKYQPIKSSNFEVRKPFTMLHSFLSNTKDTNIYKSSTINETSIKDTNNRREKFSYNFPKPSIV
ncbi:Hypothetical protein SRAE_2000468300 [Strongyloides ratti]|uniref:Winged helix-turn-helix DNA-binding domain-containing protein n=1 Tax=Strongyloides ratti TaxID=34506 RepID=A0A090LJP2_STRRB|nr:Hypothetical protein SRAE_2000468300 [Strongyloides ratti]CEF70042.1 Hypothetical protein SRAE_2000468300 [Strongyloides ratti]